MSMLKSGLCWLALLALFAPRIVSGFDEAAPASPADAPDVAAGHSYHGETFNEGPRQAAELIPGTGNVQLTVTTAKPEAQAFFNQGLGQIHGFWYLEAERSFRQAAHLDHDCAMAYWGMAQANINNEKRAKGFLAEAMQRKDKASAHERRYIEALHEYYNGAEKDSKKRAENYAKALERIVLDYPDDLEAQALFALQLYQNKSKGVPIQSSLAVDAVLRDVLGANPLHPCHHYVIHLWDTDRAAKALASSAKCGESAPAIAHMWHMSGHIYSRLHRYEDAVWQQEASARVDHAHMMRYGLLPDEIHNFAHNNEWLIRNLIYLGRASDAVDLAKNMIELPRHPKFNSLSRGSSNFGRMRLFGALASFEMWEELISLSETRYLEPTDNEAEQVKRLRHLGVAHYRLNTPAAGQSILDELSARLERLEREKNDAVEAAQAKAREEGKNDKEIEDAGNKAGGGFTSRVTALTQATQELQGHAALARGDGTAALEAFGKAGSVRTLWKAEAHRLLGEFDKAFELLKKDADSSTNQTLPLADAAWFHYESGWTDDAEKYFERLRKISGSIDLSVRPFARLTSLAAELGLSENWRLPYVVPEDFGARPELASLGPFRWQPSPAQDFTLRDVHGNEVSLASYRGKPVVVIFYLGFGCLHCVEQLQAFAPKAAEFEREGITLLAISTDSSSDLHKSYENYDGTFPITLLSDRGLETFKAYRAHDDFESQPLHATVLIDGEGLVRWRDIGFEPFNNPDFVLNEARRLLHLNEPAPAPTSTAQRETPLVAPRPAEATSASSTSGGE